jgi:hypothetical protein
LQIVAFRVSAWDEPFWVNENRGARRYNKAFTGPVQYWSLHPLTPWAEILRGQGIRAPEDVAELRQRLWVARFELEPDPVTFDAAASYGLEPQHLINFALPNAIVVPSAALPGTKNLVVFGPLVGSPYSAEPLSAEDVPAAVAADHARPPDTLLPLVRHFGEPHAEYDAWSRGERYRFREPRATRLE